MSFDTVWDFDTDMPARPLDPVSGKVRDDAGGPRFNFGVFIEMAGHLGRLVNNLEAEQRRRQARANAIPPDYTVSGAGIFPASGNLLINLGSPDQGSQWELRQLIIGGSDINTSPAGTGWVVVTGSPANYAGNNVPITQVKDITPSGGLPQKTFYGTHSLVINDSEYLSVVITGGQSGVQYVAAGKVEIFDLSVRSLPMFSE